MKVPFGIAQVGKAFRNEIVTKNFIFRTCEFEQMEMQYFIKPGTDMEIFEKWRQARMAYYPRVLGINPEHLRFHQHGPDELAFYAKIAYDIEYLFPMGFKELEGIHNRNQYDLTQHTKFSGKKDLEYINPEDPKERYLPAVIETSVGLTRSVLMCLCEAYDEEEAPAANGGTETRVVMHFHPRIAPVTVAVLPLFKKEGLAELAQDIRKQLKEDFTTDYDTSGNIGRRYRRQDEAGTPFCVTVDFDSKEKHDVTLRFRDSMEQIRVPIAELSEKIRQGIKDWKRPE
jgi:glycyl-tRNA synthetase